MQFWFRNLFLIVVLQVLSLAELGNCQQPQFLGKIVSDTINSSFGRRILPMSDQNDDGHADLLIYDSRHVFQLFHGGQAVSNVSQLRVNNQSRPIGLNYDANGDGYLDWAVHSLPGTDNRLNIYFGGPNIDTLRDWWFGQDSLTGYTYFSSLTSDINSNGFREIISDYLISGDNRLQFFELTTPWDSARDFTISVPDSIPGLIDFVGRFALGDYNGDGWQDIAASARPIGSDVTGAICVYYGGPSFDTLLDVIFYRPGGYVVGSEFFGAYVLLCPGDINADGWDDLVAGSGQAGDDSLTFVFFGGPLFDSVPDVIFIEPITGLNVAGDINQDGSQDLIASFSLPWIGGGHVQLYFGGPGIDSIPDWEIKASSLPGLNSQMGMDVTGIGDFSGDGVDDVAFATVDNQTGTVWIYAGFQDPTDVPYEYNPTLPSGYELSQNYPNPFNPSTRIAFSLPLAGTTKLTVYNVLGEQICVLINGPLSAGQYSIDWNGLDSRGGQVASGIYFYQLTSGDYSDSRKMLKLK